MTTPTDSDEEPCTLTIESEQTNYVDVLPLDESFRGEAVFISFERGFAGKRLAISPADAVRVHALLGTHLTGRIVTLSASSGKMIRIEVVPS